MRCPSPIRASQEQVYRVGRPPVHLTHERRRTVERARRRNSRQREAVTAGLLIAPGALTIIALFLVPIGYILLLSVTDPVVSLGHYRRLFTVPLYASVMINTFRTALIVTLACLVLGYPLAYVMARRNDTVAVMLLVAVGLSFWTGFVVRSYAWLRAAEGLGARPLDAFAHVFLPLSLPGVVNGSLLVFTMCLGFYITPILLGTPKDMMISQLINQQIEDLLAWGFASAIAVVLLAATLVLLGIYNRFAGLDRLWG